MQPCARCALPCTSCNPCPPQHPRYAVHRVSVAPTRCPASNPCARGTPSVRRPTPLNIRIRPPKLRFTPRSCTTDFRSFVPVREASFATFDPWSPDSRASPWVLKRFPREIRFGSTVNWLQNPGESFKTRGKASGGLRASARRSFFVPIHFSDNSLRGAPDVFLV